MTALNKQALREELEICSKDRMRRIALALLDELEAMQKTSEARREAILRTHKMFQKQRDRAVSAEKRIAEKIEYYSKRIARLKARSISLTLPPRKTFDDYINDEFDASDLAAIYNACRLECEMKFKDACRAAGIGVKGE